MIQCLEAAIERRVSEVRAYYHLSDLCLSAYVSKNDNFFTIVRRSEEQNLNGHILFLFIHNDSLNL